MGVLIALVEVGVPIATAAFVATAIGGVFCFVWNKYLAFRDHSVLAVGQVVRYGSVAVATALLMALAMELVAVECMCRSCSRSSRARCWCSVRGHIQPSACSCFAQSPCRLRATRRSSPAISDPIGLLLGSRWSCVSALAGIERRRTQCVTTGAMLVDDRTRWPGRESRCLLSLVCHCSRWLAAEVERQARRQMRPPRRPMAPRRRVRRRPVRPKTRIATPSPMAVGNTELRHGAAPRTRVEEAARRTCAGKVPPPLPAPARVRLPRRAPAAPARRTLLARKSLRFRP